jgi:hypothetical protein
MEVIPQSLCEVSRYVHICQDFVLVCLTIVFLICFMFFLLLLPKLHPPLACVVYGCVECDKFPVPLGLKAGRFVGDGRRDASSPCKDGKCTYTDIHTTPLFWKSALIMASRYPRERAEVDRKKRRAADTTHFLFPCISSLQ